jgi:hypothetical protein
MKYIVGTLAFMVLSGLLAVGWSTASGDDATRSAYDAGRVVGASLAPLLIGGVVVLLARLMGKARAPGAGARLVFWTVAVIFLLQVANLGLSASGPAGSRAMTAAERQGLEVGPDSIRHAAFAFALPSPGVRFHASPQLQQVLEKQFAQQPNIGGWALQSDSTGGVVIVLATKADRMTEAAFRGFARGVRKGTGGAEGLNVLEDSVTWTGPTREYRFWAQTREYRYLGIRCLPGGRAGTPVIVCVETVSASPGGNDELEFVRTGFAVGR